MSNLWIRNEHGKPSFTLTAAVVTLIVVLVKTLLGGVSFAGIVFGAPLDAGTIAALLTPTLGAYVVRRGSKQGGAGGTAC